MKGVQLYIRILDDQVPPAAWLTTLLRCYSRSFFLRKKSLTYKHIPIYMILWWPSFACGFLMGDLNTYNKKQSCLNAYTMHNFFFLYFYFCIFFTIFSYHHYNTPHVFGFLARARRNPWALVDILSCFPFLRPPSLFANVHKKTRNSYTWRPFLGNPKKTANESASYLANFFPANFKPHLKYIFLKLRHTKLEKKKLILFFIFLFQVRIVLQGSL